MVLALLLPAAAAAGQAQSSYDALIRDAVDEYHAGNWAEAHVLFEQAHALSPSARTFRGLGLADFELKQYAAAVHELEAALSDGERPLDPQQRSEVTRVLGRARLFTAEYRLIVPAGTDQISVDGKAQPIAASGRLLLDPGAHVVAVRSPSGAEERKQVEAEVGARGELRFDATIPAAESSAPDIAPSAAAPNSRSAGPVMDAGETHPHGRFWTWIAVGGTGLFLASTLTFALLTKSEYDDAKRFTEHCSDCTAMQIRDAEAPARRYQTLTNVSIGLASAAAVTALVLYFVEPGASSQATVEARRSGAALKVRF